MLVLSRKIGQRIAIGENVELTVLQIRGQRVRLGVAAPHGIAIHRAEVPGRLQATPALPLREPCGPAEEPAHLHHDASLTR